MYKMLRKIEIVLVSQKYVNILKAGSYLSTVSSKYYLILFVSK